MPNKIWNILAIISLIISILAIFIAVYLSQPVNLKVWHKIDEENGKLLIYGKNNDFLRSTGTISIYRIEANPNKPHIQLNSLKPREERLLTGLNINIEEVNISTDMPGISKSGKFINCSASSELIYHLYFITEQTSISYKISCDNCPSQGIIKRIPDFSNAELFLSPNLSTRQCTWSIPIYSWKNFSVESIQ